MATYKEIHGVKVQYRDSDATVIEGDVWYNASTGLLKMYAAEGSWSSGGNLNTARGYGCAAGTQTAGLCIGGIDGPQKAEVESYDGSSWTEIADINTARGNSGSGGTQTAAIIFGGQAPDAETEIWNGTSWTEVGDLNTARKTQGNGTTTSAIAYGGGPPGVANVETWNGSSWTETTDINTLRYYGTGVGTGNDNAMMIGGQTHAPAYIAVCEIWNGTAWTEVADLNTGRSTLGGAGTTTAAVAYGGGSPGKDETEIWNGTAWTEVNDMTTARYGVTRNDTGSQTAALCSGGTLNPGWVQTTEEWSFAAAIETVAFD